MPSRDRRLNPDLERALPADSDQDPPGYRRVMQVHEIRFGDGGWRPVTVRAAWEDKQNRLVMKVEWSIDGEAYGEAYLYDAAKVREAS